MIEVSLEFVGVPNLFRAKVFVELLESTKMAQKLTNAPVSLFVQKLTPLNLKRRSNFAK